MREYYPQASESRPALLSPELLASGAAAVAILNGKFQHRDSGSRQFGDLLRTETKTFLSQGETQQ